MPKKNLTVRGVARLKPGPRIEIWDTREPGLYVRIGARKIVYGVRCNVGAQRIRATIGPTDEWTLDAARTKAREIREAAEGSTNRPVEIHTFEDLAEQYLERHARKLKRTAGEDERMIRVEMIPAFGSKPIERVEKRDVIKVVEGIANRKAPYMSNRVRSVAIGIFNWAETMDLCHSNPCSKLRKFGKEEARLRVLSDAEVRSIWAVVDDHDSPLAAAVKLMLLTGQRRNEVCGMRWAEIDMDAAMWNLPPDRVKNAQAHKVPLAPSVLDLLERIRDRQIEDERQRAKRTRQEPREHVFVFPNSRNWLKPVISIKAIKADIQRDAGITERWTLHDLRRTMATRLADLHTPSQVIGRILNHAPVSVTEKHYIHSEFENEKREALELWARRLNVIVSGLAAVQVEAGS